MWCSNSSAASGSYMNLSTECIYKVVDIHRKLSILSPVDSIQQ